MPRSWRLTVPAAVWVLAGALALGPAAASFAGEERSAAPFQFSGYVFDERGAPLPGVHVDLRRSLDPGDGLCRRLSTDAEGRFAAFLPREFDCAGRPWAFPDPFFVKVSSSDSDSEDRSGFEPARWLKVQPAGKYVELTLIAHGASWTTRQPDCRSCRRCLQADSRRTVAGRVKDAAGRPVAGARIRIAAAGGEPAGWVETDAAGRYEAWLPEGRECGGPLRYPAELTLSLAPPPGLYFPQTAGLRKITVTAEDAGAALEWVVPETKPTPGRVCGTVRLGKRILPYGFVSLFPDERTWAGKDAWGAGAPHPGQTERSMASLTKDGFCLDGVAPGNYLLKLSPPALWPADSHVARRFLRIRFRGLRGEAEDYRLTVDGLGQASLFDRHGERVRRGKLPDFIVAEHSSEAPMRLEGRIIPPPGEDSGSPPPLLFAQVLSTAEAGPNLFSNTYHFSWLEGVRTGGEPRPFSLPLATGRLHELRVFSDHMALASVRLPMTRNIAAPARRVDLHLARAGHAQGVVRLPDERPFSPRLREDREKSLMSVRAARYWDHYYTADGAYVDADGRFSLPPLSPGFYRLELRGDGESFDWSVAPPEWVWLGSGQTHRREIVLGERVEVCVDGDDAILKSLEPYPGPGPSELLLFSMSWPRERWIVGLPPGALVEENASRLLFSDWAPFAFLQDSMGSWLPSFRSGPLADLSARVLPGTYDVYLVERTHKFERPSLRVLAVEKGFRVEKGRVANIRFSKRSLPNAAETELRGRLRDRPRVDAAALRGSRSLAELHAMAVPRVHFYDGGGAYAGTAFLSMSADELGRLIEGVEKDNPVQVSQYIDRWPYEFRMGGLRPGRYRAEIIAYGRPKRVETIVLKAGERLELDLGDAPGN